MKKAIFEIYTMGNGKDRSVMGLTSKYLGYHTDNLSGRNRHVITHLKTGASMFRFSTAKKAHSFIKKAEEQVPNTLEMLTIDNAHEYFTLFIQLKNSICD